MCDGYIIFFYFTFFSISFFHNFLFINNGINLLFLSLKFIYLFFPLKVGQDFNTWFKGLNKLPCCLLRLSTLSTSEAYEMPSVFIKATLIWILASKGLNKFICCLLWLSTLSTSKVHKMSSLFVKATLISTRKSSRNRQAVFCLSSSILSLSNSFAWVEWDNSDPWSATCK